MINPVTPLIPFAGAESHQSEYTELRREPTLGVDVPVYSESVEQQFDIHAQLIIDKLGLMLRTEEVVNTAVIYGFITGASDFTDPLEAGFFLESGGFGLMLEKLEITDMNDDIAALLDDETFAAIVRAAIAWGPKFCDLGQELTEEAIDAALDGQDLLGPITSRFFA